MDPMSSLAILEPRNLAELKDVADIFFKSGLFSDTKGMAQAVVKIMAGRELGFGAFASMKGINIIQGQVAIGANLIAAAIKRRDSGRYDYRIKELTDTACEIEFYEGGQVVGTSRFTMDDARKAGLDSKKNWQTYPRNMLFSRALSNGARWYTPDVFGGPMYTPDELGAEVNEDGEVIEGAYTASAQPVIVDQPADAEPEPHWTQDPALVRKTEQWLAKKGIEDRDANAALGLDDWRTTDLDKKPFADAVLAYVDEQARAAEASGEAAADTFADEAAAELGATVSE